MTKIQTIIVDDNVIDIHYNENLKQKPYLVRLFNYSNEIYELRLDTDDLRELSHILDKIHER